MILRLRQLLWEALDLLSQGQQLAVEGKLLEAIELIQALTALTEEKSYRTGWELD